MNERMRAAELYTLNIHLTGVHQNIRRVAIPACTDLRSALKQFVLHFTIWSATKLKNLVLFVCLFKEFRVTSA